MVNLMMQGGDNAPVILIGKALAALTGESCSQPSKARLERSAKAAGEDSAAVSASAVFPGTVRVIDTDTAGMALGAAAMVAVVAGLWPSRGRTEGEQR